MKFQPLFRIGGDHWIKNRDFTIDKEWGVQGFHNWLKFQTLFRIGREYRIKKRVDKSRHLKKGGLKGIHSKCFSLLSPQVLVHWVLVVIGSNSSAPWNKGLLDFV